MLGKDVYQMDIMVLLNQMIILFLLMFLGFFLSKTGIMTDHFNKQLTKLILDITTPCLILSSVLDGSSSLTPAEIATAFLTALVLYLILPLISRLITIIIRAPKEQQGIYDFLGTYANIGYMGFPIIASLFGSSALLYTAIFNIIFNLSAFSVGVLMISRGSSHEATFSPKKLVSPGVLLSAVSIVIYLCGIHFPDPVTSAITSVGQLTTPLAMMMIGATLATMNIREVLTEKRVYAYTLLRQVILPLLIWPLMKLVLHDELLLSVCFVLFIMPAGNISVLFATNYNLDAKLAAKAVFVTTLLSIITVPLLLYFCMGA